MRIRHVLSIATVVLLVGGCAARTETESVEAQAHPVASGAVTGPSAEACTFSGTTEPKAGSPEAGPMFLTDVRVGTHGCFERVVFEVRPREGEPATPLGYRVEHQPGPVTQDGSGDPVDVKGAAFLVVILSATGVDLTKPDAPEVYTGPAVIETAGTTRIQQVRRVSDFEGVVTWAIGLDARRPFHVEVQESPTRLVVDVGDG